MEYLHPPGIAAYPIAMPGKASLLAAIQPAQSKALYFVAKGNGASHFSATLDEHIGRSTNTSEGSSPNRPTSMSGLFISFEGIDGAGKSTHIDGLAQAFRAQGRRVTLTVNPVVRLWLKNCGA